MRRMTVSYYLLTLCVALMASVPARCEDGYELWLRYRPLGQQAQVQLARDLKGLVVTTPVTITVEAALQELDRGLTAMMGRAPKRVAAPGEGTLVIGTATDPAIRRLALPLESLRDEGYLLRNQLLDGRRVTVLTANTDRGLLYGSFELLRYLQAGRPLQQLDVSSAPRIQLRMLNHWDNLDGHVERGYAGASLWDWWRLPDLVDPRYRDYARANASIGINATVVNNVNAVAAVLQPAFIDKLKVLADVFRPYGIRVFLAVRFSSPIELDGLATADPLDPAVRDWWRRKAEAIYSRIPDFGGFLVKANSEGQPGPADYGRTHADGANALAEALRPHGGVVLWRAFVYSEQDVTDRAKQAYAQLQGLDGRFADNVVLQVKNGPIDFQPREPFHPLFGAMPNTALGLELQITKEYLGFATHLAYLGPLYEEVLRSDTHGQGTGTTVARVIAGATASRKISAIAGVANTGRDRNWSGSHFDQANWYVFGRLAWNPELSAQAVAQDWVQRTFDMQGEAAAPVIDMLMASREAVVNYMTPLGLAHLMGAGHHYGPAPWIASLSRPEWNPVYYHRADSQGVGFDRTATGSNAIAQYAAPVAALYADPETVPLELLLWFHRVPWTQQLRTGRTLWEELLARYDAGVASVIHWQAVWSGMKDVIDPQRHEEVAAALRIQLREARWWRDASIAYWQSIAGLPLPAGVAAPEHALAEYQQLSFPDAPGR